MADETPKPRPPFYRRNAGWPEFDFEGRAEDPTMRRFWDVEILGRPSYNRELGAPEAWVMDPTKPPLEAAAGRRPSGIWNNHPIPVEPLTGEEYAQVMGHPPTPGLRGVVSSGRVMTDGEWPATIMEKLPPHLREAMLEIQKRHPEIVLGWDSRRQNPPVVEASPAFTWTETELPPHVRKAMAEQLPNMIPEGDPGPPDFYLEDALANAKASALPNAKTSFNPNGSEFKMPPLARVSRGIMPVVAEGLHYLGGIAGPAAMLYQVRQEANQRERDIEWAKRPRGRQGPTYLSEGKPQPRQADGAWIDNSAVERQRAMRRYTQSTRNN